MGHFNIDLLKSHANNVTSNVSEVITCFFVSYIQQPTHVVGSSATTTDNIFMNSVAFITISGNLVCQLGDHLLQFLVLKDFRVSYYTPCSLKHNSILLSNPVEIAETFYFFFTNIGPNTAKRLTKGKTSPTTYLNGKTLKSFFCCPTTPDEITRSFNVSLTTN